jgi:hypothetical protein
MELRALMEVIIMELIKFIGRLIGIKRYKIFIVIDQDCWRQRRCGQFIRFKKACEMADILKKLELVNDAEYVVATGMRISDKALYSAQ